MTYAEFLAGKHIRAHAVGFEPGALADGLYPYQADVVRWACRLGRAAVFADCGMGKTAIQLAWADQVATHTDRPVLVLSPLAVAYQTQREGARFGLDVALERAGESGRIVACNYERLAHINPSDYAGVVLDESGILKQYAGKVKRALCEAFAATPYRLCCTATPAPNDHQELGNHSEFLSIMPSNEMLSRWFVNEYTAGAYRLKRHAESDFWAWVASWAVGFSHPRDLGDDRPGFDLPPLVERLHVVDCPGDPADGWLFDVPDKINATTMHKALRLSARARAAAVAGLVRDMPDERWLIWCYSNYDADAVCRELPEAVEVRGSHAADVKERALRNFADGAVQVLVTKPGIAGLGMNFQACARIAFLGLTFSYESFYQAVRRCWRYGQTRQVEAHVVIGAAEDALWSTIRRKREADELLRRALTSELRNVHTLMRGRGLQMDVERQVGRGASWELRLGDCVEELRGVPDGEVDLSVFSPPFSSLYIYSDSARDMGNSADDAEFFEHFGYAIAELLRVTRPGRLACVHCKQLVYYRGDRGTAGLRDFRGEIIRRFTGAGWDYHSEVTIWTDPVTEMQRTKAHGLLHKQVCTDSTFSRQGLADYLVMFRRWAKTAEEIESVSPVAREAGKRFRPAEYVGQDRPRDALPALDGSIQVWQRYASPVWFDINRMRVLNVEAARGEKDERHLCPLQLDVIARAIDLWSNPGDLVLSPFAGIGSEGYEAVRMGRRFLGIELKDSYFRTACNNLRRAEREANQPSLFDEEAAHATE